MQRHTYMVQRWRCPGRAPAAGGLGFACYAPPAPPASCYTISLTALLTQACAIATFDIERMSEARCALGAHRLPLRRAVGHQAPPGFAFGRHGRTVSNPSRMLGPAIPRTVRHGPELSRRR
eukprot:CAMPEP_0206030188 /NCGR_PEP_ID=MMETSP1464-20131121/47391_1 /ASSEMBLY_ACC=CAM_ASM_001124 /TAXON_ID=119497 /ORGANISM="Exanthemachrysis gayraliae, Strain RCC1523" /LENGTH=120 /DNA_ID=CAMNT_0053404291 /DNA_START=447 /DNA_END=806 /DNA_ORIENTATION=-